MKQQSEQYELMKSGKSYHFDDYLFGMQKKASRLVKKINALPFGDRRRDRLFSRLFARYGEGNVIKDNFICNFGSNISIGNNCYINHGVTILDSYEVEIGNNVFFAPGVIVTAVTHPLQAEKRRELIIKKVTIEDDAWIGAGAVIFPGVTIHRGAVIAAGAIVNRDVDAFTVVGGTPAKFIKKIEKE